MTDTRKEIDVIAEDERTLRSLGYKQELLRKMSGFSNFAISMSIICILAGGVTSFHQGLSSVGGAAFGLAVAFGFGVLGCAGGVAMHQFPYPLRSIALHLVAVHARPDGDVCPDVSVPKRPFSSKGNLASLVQSPSPMTYSPGRLLRWCPSIACMQYVQRAHACCYPPEARDTIHLTSAPSVPVVRGWRPAICVSKCRNSLTRCVP